MEKLHFCWSNCSTIYSKIPWWLYSHEFRKSVVDKEPINSSRWCACFWSGRYSWIETFGRCCCLSATWTAATSGWNGRLVEVLYFLICLWGHLSHHQKLGHVLFILHFPVYRLDLPTYHVSYRGQIKAVFCHLLHIWKIRADKSLEAKEQTRITI